MFRKIIWSVSLLVLGVGLVGAQTVTIDGVTDRSKYNDSATFRVQANAGFTYLATLNGVPVPVGVSNTVAKMDYYELAVSRTNASTLAVTNVLVRFIVLSSRRGSPELGLIEWVPLPPIPSSDAEVSGGTPLLHLMMPSRYPAGLEIPVTVRVENVNGTRRVNGWVTNSGAAAAPFRVLRGVGHGFLPAAPADSSVNYTAQLRSLQTNQLVSIESTTVWTQVSGVLAGTTAWPMNSRIHVTGHLTIPAGATLSIGEGTVVRLNPGVNITNSGHTIIDGTIKQPVVFTPTNHVAPEQRAGAWGGWLIRGASAELIANATIMTGSGAAGGFSFSPGSSHRSEQPLLLVHSGATVRMTNCALINNAGQVGNGYFSSIVWDHCLIQRAVTVGEYEGCTNVFNHSALIEFPSVDGIYNATIADSDYDGFYAIGGTNFLANSLFGFAKDDAIDSGSGGPGMIVVSNCWVESALHEALAWSGEGRRTWTYNSVLINSGQGIECGWSTTNASSPVTPICFASNILSTANSVGARYGDNYEGTSGLGSKAGFLTITNSFILHNYRDVFGRPWDNTWNWRSNNMDIRSNYLTAANAYHPSNLVWNPAVDGARLASFMTTPPEAPVGIGLALWSSQISTADSTNGIPVRLSSFTTNVVNVDYEIETPNGVVATGTLAFTPGETVKRIFGDPAMLGATTWRVVLRNPVGGELTGTTVAYAVLQPSLPVTLIPSGSAWRYLDDGSNQGTAWRNPGFNDTTWSNGVAQLGFGDNDEATRIRRTNNATMGNTITTFYFRRAFTTTNAAAFGDLSMWMLRDDGGVVYLNGNEMYRSPTMPAAPTTITSATFANAQGSSPPDNSIDTAVWNTASLLNGTNVLAVEIHQFDPPSSDVSFDFSLTGNPAIPTRVYTERFGNDLALYWNAPGYVLEQADDVTGPWTTASDEGVATAQLSAPQKFFRLRKL